MKLLEFLDRTGKHVNRKTFEKYKDKKMECQGWNLAHYAFSKDALEPTVYYDETLDCTLFFDNKHFHCFEGKDLGNEVFLLTKRSDGAFDLVSDDTFGACDKYADFVVNACEGDLSKVRVNTLDYGNIQLGQLIGVIEDI